MKSLYFVPLCVTQYCNYDAIQSKQNNMKNKHFEPVNLI